MTKQSGPEDRHLTVEEYARLPDDDAFSDELVRGRVVRYPRPETFASIVATKVTHRMYEFVKEHGLGEVLPGVGVILSRDPDTVRGPRVSFYSTERVPAERFDALYWGAPDLAVEVLSSTSLAADVMERVVDYLDAGVRSVQVFDPRTRSVTVYRADGTARLLRGDAVLEGDDILSGFRLPIADVFSI
jgi:Uma2 family endonuclease